MTEPCLEIHLGKIHYNARALVLALADRGISTTGVTKATLGLSEIANVLLRAGVKALGDSRIENIERLRRAHLPGPMVLIRSPMVSQVERVVASADASFNTELTVIHELSKAARAAGTTHGVILMVELGDLREGIMPIDLQAFVREILGSPGILLVGIGANLACQSGVAPDASKMGELSTLADSITESFGVDLPIVSGGNSANLSWALSSAEHGRINDLRLGESILLGRETLHREVIEGLYTDAISLVGEVIESKIKPTLPWGEIAETAYGEPLPVTDRGSKVRMILALGRQDTDPNGLGSPPGIEVCGATSDHLIVESSLCEGIEVGAMIAFRLDYSALSRAMASPFASKRFIREECRGPQASPQREPTMSWVLPPSKERQT